MSRRHRRRRIAQKPLFETLEQRIVLGYFSNDPVDENPTPETPTDCPCTITGAS